MGNSPRGEDAKNQSWQEVHLADHPCINASLLEILVECWKYSTTLPANPLQKRSAMREKIGRAVLVHQQCGLPGGEDGSNKSSPRSQTAHGH
jgi:hypothetical protein